MDSIDEDAEVELEEAEIEIAQEAIFYDFRQDHDDTCPILEIDVKPRQSFAQRILARIRGFFAAIAIIPGAEASVMVGPLDKDDKDDFYINLVMTLDKENKKEVKILCLHKTS